MQMDCVQLEITGGGQVPRLLPSVSRGLRRYVALYFPFRAFTDSFLLSTKVLTPVLPSISTKRLPVLPFLVSAQLYMVSLSP